MLTNTTSYTLTKMKVIITTAANANYFYLVRCLLSSIRDKKNNLDIQIGLLDVGLTSEQRTVLGKLVNNIVTPGWDFNFPTKSQVPGWFRAMTARPFLPKYFPDFDIYIWIDSDAWIQNWAAIEALIDTAKDGNLAIVEETFGKGIFIQYINQDKQEAVFSVTPKNIQENIISCYSISYGEDIAAMYGHLLPINSGVFAMRGDVPHWQIWAKYLERGLQRQVHKLIEQQALNIAIRRGEIPARFLPNWCNWVLIHKLPLFDSQTYQFVLPDNPLQPIGILHLADLKKFMWLSVPQVSGGRENVPLTYLEIQKRYQNYK